jgi:hypothetical protein
VFSIDCYGVDSCKCENIIVLTEGVAELIQNIKSKEKKKRKTEVQIKKLSR